MRQLPLDLPLPPRYGRDAFLPAPSNAAALRTLESWPAWPDRSLLLIGPAGAGKSHLAAIWAARAGAARLEPAALARADLPSLIGRAVLLEDADAAAKAGEAGLFHLVNLVREEGADLLMTARTAPDHWGLRTPDLLSRLRLAPVVAVGAPDDDLMRAVLAKLFADRQIVVDETVIAYLVLHLDRSLASARQAVEELDRAGLALGRRVTRALAATVVGALPPTGEGD